MTYQYWVIRFVPNVARGEFTNIGILCGADGADWSVRFDPRFVRNHGRLSSDLRELAHWMRWFQRLVDGHLQGGLREEGLTSGWVEQFRARQANAVQFSEPMPIDVEGARAGVALLFPHLVERPPIRRRRGVSRASLRADVRDTLIYEAGFMLGRNLFSQPRARVGKQHGSFDLMRSHQSGASPALTNVWAFNVASLDALERDVQAWNYFVSRVRDSGGTVGAENNARHVESDVPIEVVFDAPASDMRDGQRRMEIFEGAREAWELSGVAVRSVDRFHREVPELVR